MFIPTVLGATVLTIYLVSSQSKNNSGMLTLFLWTILAFLSYTYRKMVPPLFWILVVLGGTISEIICIHASPDGTWQYIRPDYMRVPNWLWPLWGIVGGTVLALYFFSLKLNLFQIINQYLSRRI